VFTPDSFTWFSSARSFSPERRASAASDRLAFDAERNILFLNFEGLHVRNSGDVAAIREAVTQKIREIVRRVAVIVNYDTFRLDDEVAREYADMVRGMEDAHYTKVSRYTTSAFMRVKLGRELTRTVRPHIFESKAGGQAFHSKV
jgi:propionate CoA-transferase